MASCCWETNAAGGACSRSCGLCHGQVCCKWNRHFWCRMKRQCQCTLFYNLCQNPSRSKRLHFGRWRPLFLLAHLHVFYTIMIAPYKIIIMIVVMIMKPTSITAAADIVGALVFNCKQLISKHTDCHSLQPTLLQSTMWRGSVFGNLLKSICKKINLHLIWKSHSVCLCKKTEILGNLTWVLLLIRLASTEFPVTQQTLGWPATMQG